MVSAKAKGMQHVWCEMSQSLCGHWARHIVLALCPEVCMHVLDCPYSGQTKLCNIPWEVLVGRRSHRRQGLRPTGVSAQAAPKCSTAGLVFIHPCSQ